MSKRKPTNRELSIFAIKFAVIALAINMFLFTFPLILEIVKPSIKIYATCFVIIYGIFGGTILLYLGIRINSK